MDQALFNRPEDLRPALAKAEKDLIATVSSYAGLTIHGSSLYVKGSGNFEFDRKARKRMDKILGLKGTRFSEVTDEQRNAILGRKASRKIKVIFDGRTGALVTMGGIDEQYYSPARIAMWGSLFCNNAPYLLMDVKEFNHHELVAEITDDRWHIEAAPGDVLKTSLILRTEAMMGHLELDAKLYRLVCENGSYIAEATRKTHVSEKADAGAYRMNLNKKLNSQLKRFETVNQGIRHLIDDRPRNLPELTEEWLSRHQQRKEVRNAILEDLIKTNGVSKYDVFNAITHARHDLRADSATIHNLGVLAGTYFTEETAQEELTV